MWETDEYKENHLYFDHHFDIFSIIFLIDATYLPINIRCKFISIYVYYIKYIKHITIYIYSMYIMHIYEFIAINSWIILDL